jgi:hypothetical protein
MQATNPNIAQFILTLLKCEDYNILNLKNVFLEALKQSLTKEKI